MGSLVMAHEEEGTRLVAGLDPIEGLVGDDVCHIAGIDMSAIGFDELGIPVFTLAREDRPVVKARRPVLWLFSHMPLSDHGCLVASGSEMLRDVGDMLVDLHSISLYDLYQVR